MSAFDWIVVGAGITGAALGYELAKQGFSVLLIDQSATPTSATLFSYGGIAYWSGTSDLTRQLCAEGIDRHRLLSLELDADTEFRELDLLLTISAETDPRTLNDRYSGFEIPPRSLSVKEACELEPLLDPEGISGALTVRHGHINAQKTTQAYRQAMQRFGGKYTIAKVTGFNLKEISASAESSPSNRITGVVTSEGQFNAGNVAVCVGGMTRQFLKQAGIAVTQYFTHAELIETPPVELALQTLVMPAEADRFQLEADATRPEVDDLWNTPGHEPAPMILDAGAVQFRDRRLYIGQVSRTLSDPNAQIDAIASEFLLREKIRRVLPIVADLPGTWRHCLIAFSRDRLPLVGAIAGIEGMAIFSGFSNPLAIVPPLAKRFAIASQASGIAAVGQSDRLLAALSPQRFESMEVD